jgi:hypothetical protein
LNGSTGKVGPPIISRIIQFLSDGMIYYNHARKIMFIPFPFPHAQLSVLFVLIAIPAVAFLMDQYADNVVLGSVLSFFSIACLSGIHEVARELENPFRNIPNELPLVTLQAQFNEALITMYSGYHPDHFWDPKRHDRHPSDPPRQKNSAQSRRRASSSSAEQKKVSEATSPPNGPRPLQSVSPQAATQNDPSPSMTSEGAPTYSEAASKPPPANGKQSNSSADEKLSEMQSKMEEYGKEIERLRALLENKKTDEVAA